MSPMFDSIIPLYTYCENIAGPIPQPLNLLSCIVFLFAAGWMWHTRAEDDETPSFHQVSAVLLFLLGIFGMIWHVGGQPVAQAVDMFIMFFLFIIIAVVVCNDILRFDLGKGLGIVVTLILVSALLKNEAVSMLPQNGGLFLPILFFLAIAALKIQTISEEVTVYLLAASYTLFFGLLARSADIILCGYIPSGTHFLWHIMLSISVVYMGKTVVAMKDVPWPGEDDDLEETDQVSLELKAVPEDQE